ncbi:hypothetical protein [Spirosoma endbachense]|nr:hypothetical protein [Spirosoma endbachense]
MTRQRLASTRQVEGVQVPAGFPAAKTQVSIPANSRATILLDQGFLTNAYPTLLFSGGRQAGISMGYAEGLYIGKKEALNAARVPSLPKGNRNEIDDKLFIGRADSVVILTKAIRKQIVQRMKGGTNRLYGLACYKWAFLSTIRVGFILQLGYFRVVTRFFVPDRFHQTDLEWVCGQLQIAPELKPVLRSRPVCGLAGTGCWYYLRCARSIQAIFSCFSSSPVTKSPVPASLWAS